MKKNKPQRLSKWLVQLGYCETRREAERFVDERVIMMGDDVIARADAKVWPEDIQIDGDPMDAARLVILLHKPAGYVCSHEDSGLRVYDLLPERYRRRQPKLVTVGRLDKDTTGMLLLTDDGMLLHQLTHPRSHVAKTYEVELAQSLKGDEAKKFASGALKLEGEDKPLLPAEMTPSGENTATLILHEGRYHQVKRMFAATGNEVVKLHRSAIGSLTLGALGEGEWRHVEDEELKTLFSET